MKKNDLIKNKTKIFRPPIIFLKKGKAGPRAKFDKQTHFSFTGQPGPARL